MIASPKIGMKVSLNDEGMEQIGGLRSMVQVKDATCMTIIGMHEIACDDGPLWQLDVDNSLNTFLFTNYDVDEFKGTPL